MTTGPIALCVSPPLTYSTPTTAPWASVRSFFASAFVTIFASSPSVPSITFSSASMSA